MKKCPNCHKLNNKNAKFCKYCGHKLLKKNNVSNTNKKNYIICPNCGKKNTKSAKFCLNCGYNLKKKPNKAKQYNKKNQHNDSPQRHTVKTTSADKNRNFHTRTEIFDDKNKKDTTKKPNREKYQKEWQNANKTIKSVSKHSNNYFLWLKECFKNPTGKHVGTPYSGAITLGIQAILMFLIMMIGNHNETVGDTVHSLIGYLPIQTYWNNYNNIFNPLALIIGIVLFYISYILIGLLVNLIFSKSTIEMNLLQCTNRLASISTPAMVILALLFIVAIIGSDPLVEILATVTLMTYYIGLAVFITKQKLNINAIYISIGAVLIWYLIKGLVTTALVLVI